MTHPMGIAWVALDVIWVKTFFFVTLNIIKTIWTKMFFENEKKVKIVEGFLKTAIFWKVKP